MTVPQDGQRLLPMIQDNLPLMCVDLRVIFTVNGASYHKICGKARGYQRHTTDAFGGVGTMPRKPKSINEAYVDGLSITLGSPRKHGWTYAVGFSDELSSLGNCPCGATPGEAAFPFMKDDYYCESGSPTTARPSNAFLTNDPRIYIVKTEK